MGQTGSPEVEISILGRLGSAVFPVQPGFYIPEKYIYKEVLTIEPLNHSEVVRPVFLYSDWRMEVVPVDSGGKSRMGGVTFDELLDAYSLGLLVEVKGHTLNLSRDGRSYSCFFVDEVRILEPGSAPLVIYHTVISSMSTNYEIWLLDERVQMPQYFHVGRNSTGVNWTDTKHVFNVKLNPGDCIGYDYNASEPVDLTIYCPETPGYEGNTTVWGAKCREETGTSPRLNEFIALTRGEYNFMFNATPPTSANVTLNIWRAERDAENVLFFERGGHSSAVGGMGSECFYPRELPKRRVLGRTWSKSGAWTDHSYSFKTTLEEGTMIRFGFNSTTPINFSLSNRTDTIMGVTTEFTHTQDYVVPTTGGYTFRLSVDEPRTAVVSFRCVSPNYSVQQLSGNYSMIFGSFSDASEPKGDVFPPAINEIVKMRGRLVASFLPDSDDPVMFLETPAGEDGGETGGYLLHKGGGQALLSVPAEGYTRLGNVTLYEVNDAYLNNLTVEVHGFPFTLTRNGTRHTVFHVNAVEIIESTGLPLYAVQTMDVVSGRYHELLGGDEREYFPVEFRLGFDEYEGHHGNIERFYHVCLNKGDSVGFRFNASGPVEFGLYGNRGDHYGTMGFSLGDPEDYYIRKSKIEALGMGSPLETVFTAPRRGYYSFAFKAYSGAKTLVEFDVQRVIIRGEGFTP